MTAGKSARDPNTVLQLVGSAAQHLVSNGLGALGRLESQRAALINGLTDTGARTAAGAARNADSAARAIANRVWSGVEELFELRATRLLNTLQIPTHRDVAELSRRVDELQDLVAQLAGVETPATRRKTVGARKKKTPARKATAQKTRARKTKSRKSAARKTGARRTKPRG